MKNNFEISVKEIYDKHKGKAIDSTPSFQSDVTLGIPTVLKVCWEEGKAWLEIPYYLYDEHEPEDLIPFEEACAEFGIRNCSNYNDFNSILTELGEEAQTYQKLESDETEDIEFTM